MIDKGLISMERDSTPRGSNPQRVRFPLGGIKYFHILALLPRKTRRRVLTVNKHYFEARAERKIENGIY